MTQNSSGLCENQIEIKNASLQFQIKIESYFVFPKECHSFTREVCLLCDFAKLHRVVRKTASIFNAFYCVSRNCISFKCLRPKIS